MTKNPMNVNRDFYATFIGRKAEKIFTFQSNELSKRRVFRTLYSHIGIGQFSLYLSNPNTYTMYFSRKVNIKPSLRKIFSSLIKSSITKDSLFSRYLASKSFQGIKIMFLIDFLLMYSQFQFSFFERGGFLPK